LFLREAERDELVAACDARKPPRLLLVAPVEQDRKRAERVDRVGDAHAAARPGELFDHEAQIEDAPTGAAVLLGDPDAGQPGFLDGPREGPRVGLLDVVLGGDRPDAPFGDLAGALHEIDVLLAEQLSRHVVTPRKRRRTLPRWTGDARLLACAFAPE